MSPTVRVSEFTYTVLEAARRMMEEVMPFRVTFDHVIAVAAITMLSNAARLKTELLRDPRGQVYLKIAELLRERGYAEEGVERVPGGEG